MHKIVTISTTTGSIPCDYFIPIDCLNERVLFAKNILYYDGRRRRAIEEFVEVIYETI